MMAGCQVGRSPSMLAAYNCVSLWTRRYRTWKLFTVRL